MKTLFGAALLAGAAFLACDAYRALHADAPAPVDMGRYEFFAHLARQAVSLELPVTAVRRPSGALEGYAGYSPTLPADAHVLHVFQPR